MQPVDNLPIRLLAAVFSAMSKLVLSPPTTSLCLKYAVPPKLTPDVIDFLSGSNAAKAYFLLLSLRQTVIGPSVSMPVLKQIALVFLTFKPFVVAILFITVRNYGQIISNSYELSVPLI